MAPKTTSKTPSTQSPKQPSKTFDDAPENNSDLGMNLNDWSVLNDILTKVFDTNAKPLNQRINLFIWVFSIAVLFLIYVVIRVIIFLAEMFPDKSSYLLEKILQFWK